MPEISQKVLDSLNKVIIEAKIELQRKTDKETIIKEMVADILMNGIKPVFQQFSSDTRQAMWAYIEAIKKVQINTGEIKVNVPEVKVKADMPSIKIPEIKMPDLKMPEMKTDKLERAIVKAIGKMKIPAPQITVKPAEVIMPKSSIKFPDKIKIAGIDRDKPMPVELVDTKGNPYKIVIPSMGGGRSGKVSISPPQAGGSGNVTIVTAGTAVPLSASSVPCKRVIVHAVNGHVVFGIGGSVLYLVTARVGVWLSKTQREIINIDNLNKIYVDAASNGTIVSYTYEV